MRKNPETILLAKIRRHVRAICMRYNNLTKLEYPKCYSEPDKAIEKVAKKILYNVCDSILTLDHEKVIFKKKEEKG